MQTLRTERSAYLALAVTVNKPNALHNTAIDKAYAQREARKVQERLKSLSFAERLQMQINS